MLKSKIEDLQSARQNMINELNNFDKYYEKPKQDDDELDQFMN